MSKLKALTDAIVTLGWGALVALAALREAIRETNLKRRLGRDYEGPAAD